MVTGIERGGSDLTRPIDGACRVSGFGRREASSRPCRDGHKPYIHWGLPWWLFFLPRYEVRCVRCELRVGPFLTWEAAGAELLRLLACRSDLRCCPPGIRLLEERAG